MARNRRTIPMTTFSAKHAEVLTLDWQCRSMTYYPDLRAASRSLTRRELGVAQ
jgi:hypothetical protein